MALMYDLGIGPEIATTVLYRVRPYAGPPLVHREIADDVRQVDVVLAHPRNARLTRRAHAFSEFCRRTFPASAPGAVPGGWPGGEG